MPLLTWLTQSSKQLTFSPQTRARDEHPILKAAWTGFELEKRQHELWELGVYHMNVRFKTIYIYFCGSLEISVAILKQKWPAANGRRHSLEKYSSENWPLAASCCFQMELMSFWLTWSHVHEMLGVQVVSSWERCEATAIWTPRDSLFRLR